MKRPRINKKTGTANASPLVKRRGRIIQKRQGRADVAAKKAHRTPHIPKKAGRKGRKGEDGGHTPDPVAIAAATHAQKMAQEGVKVKGKKSDDRPFTASDPTLSNAIYRLMGKRGNHKFAPRVRIAEGRLPYLLQQENEKKFVGVTEFGLEMAEGREWVVMTHPDFFKKAREQIAVHA